MKIDRKFVIFSGLLCFLFGATAAQAGDNEGLWSVKGWTQWHPHQGNNTLSAIGTQYYFGSPDPEVVVEPEVVSMSEPIVKLPEVVKVVEQPSPDLDGDGVLNEQDRCPTTPTGVAVNKQGCWVLGKIFFLFDKAHVQAKFTKELDQMVDYLLAHEELNVELGGHTDSTGTEAYNNDLSVKRSMAVMEYFRKKGVGSLRMKSFGYGMMQPDTDNSTKKQRSLNRRVEVHPFK